MGFQRWKKQFLKHFWITTPQYTVAPGRTSMSIKMFTDVTDQIYTQICWHSWIGNTSLLHTIVATHLDRFDVEKQRLSASQWVLCWKASTQWRVSFRVSVSKILSWFDNAYWRSLGWTEWQAMQPLNLLSLHNQKAYVAVWTQTKSLRSKYSSAQVLTTAYWMW